MQRLLSVLSVCLLVALLGFAGMVRADLNDGLATTDPGTLLWSYQVGHDFRASPAIGSDGTIYVGSYDCSFYALNHDGSLKWSYPTGNSIYSSPSIGSDGTIYMGSKNGKLYALRTDGSIKWSYQTGADIHSSSPSIGKDGTIYVGSADHKLYALNPDGSLKWSFETGGIVHSSPSIDNDGIIYVGSLDNKFYALNRDGSLKWSHETGDIIISSPSIGSDGTIYVGSYDNKLYALNPDGSLKWSYQTGGDVGSSPSIGSNGIIYVGSKDSNLYALNPDGSLKWSYQTGDKVGSSAAIGNDGTIYVGSNDNKLYALNSDGSLKWSYQTRDAVISCPSIGSDGTVYVGSLDNNLYAINGNSGGLADTPWPMFSHDLKHTGIVPESSDSNANFIKIGDGGNSEYARSIQQTSDGGYVVVGGESSEAGEHDVSLIKFDKLGNVEWKKSFGGNGSLSKGEGAYSVKQTSDMGYIVVGLTDAFGSTRCNAFLCKFNNTGTLEWSKTAGENNCDDSLHSIEQTSDGGYIAVGQTGCNTPRTSFLILKFDNAGNLLLSKTAGGYGNDKARSVKQTPDGGYIVAGYTSSYGDGDVSALILKYDQSLNLEWAKIAGGNGKDRYLSVQLTSDVGYIVAGSTSSFGAGEKDILIVKYSSSGSQEWAKTIGGINDESAYSILQNSENDYIVAGYTSSYGSGLYDALISKLDNSGNLIWTQVSGSSNYDQFFSIYQTADAGYIMAGSYNSTNPSHWNVDGTSDIYILKTNSDGNINGCGDLSFISPIVDSPAIITKSVSLAENSSHSIAIESVAPIVTDASITFTTKCEYTAHKITATAGTGGTISPSGAVTVNPGASKTFTITANSGYQISDVKVDGASQGAISTHTFTNVTSDHTISASFTQEATTHTLTATAGTGGTISPSGAIAVNAGASKTFTITANSGYLISDVKVDGVSQGTIGVYTFTNVMGDHTISASFDQHEIVLAKYYSPVIYQHVDVDGEHGENGLADIILNFDYDGNWNGNDQWEHLTAMLPNTAKATLYYSVRESTNYWFIYYAIYHPRDWSNLVSIFGSEHENDMEAVTLMIRKESGSTYGKLMAAMTMSHNLWLEYTIDNHIESLNNNGIKNGVSYKDTLKTDGVPVEDFVQNGKHPRLYIQSRGHGTFMDANSDNCLNAGNENGIHDWDITGFPSDSGEFKGTGIVYFCSKRKNGDFFSHESHLIDSGNDQFNSPDAYPEKWIKYELHPLSELWDRRSFKVNNSLEQPWMYAEHSDAFYGEKHDEDLGLNLGVNKANPPWSMPDGSYNLVCHFEDGIGQIGQIYADPLNAFPRHFRDSDTSSHNYIENLSNEKYIDNGTTTCPECCDSPVILTNVTFSGDTVCECIDSESITIGPEVTIKSGATVTFKAPTVKIQSGLHAENGATVRITQE